MKIRTRKSLRRLVLNCAPGQLRDATIGRCGPGVGVDIPRKEMPQILSADLPAFVAYAREKRHEKRLKGPKKKPTTNKRRNPLKYDPTRTVTLRRAFRSKLHRQFSALKVAVMKLVGDEDAFGMGTVRNTRWQYESDPDAVAKFQEWLKTQIKSTIRSRTSDQLWDAYIQAGFKKGVARSFDDYTRANPGANLEKLDFYAGSKKQFLDSSFRQPVSRDKVKLLAGRTFDELENVTTDMSTKMSRVLVDGLIAGKGRREVADDLVKTVGLAETRANTIAQTELIRAHAEGQLMALDTLGVEELGVMVEWSTAGDSAVCDECEPLEGVVLKMDEAQGMIPRHPNCLPGGSLVLSRSRITAISERWYDGDLLVLETASGRVLSCTPNHPILTNAGWVPARLLDVGSYVVRDGGSEWESAVNDDGEDIPTPIHKIAESFRSSRQVVSAEVPLSAPDFHGDGKGSKVAVIRAYRQLRNGLDVSIQQHPPQRSFIARGVVNGVPLPRQCSFGSFLDRTFSPASNVVGGGYLGKTLVGIHLRPLQEFSLTLTTNDHPVADENPSDYPSAGIQSIRDCLFRFSGEVKVDDDVVRWAARNLSILPSFDQIISIERRAYQGHVYNLQTEEGFYSAEGIITHNCRCAWTPANVGEDKTDQTRTKGDIGAAIKESRGKDKGDDWGPAKAISKDRPVSQVKTTNSLDVLSHYLTDNVFNPDQPRDEKGEWTSDGGGVSIPREGDTYTLDGVNYTVSGKGFARTRGVNKGRIPIVLRGPDGSVTTRYADQLSHAPIDSSKLDSVKQPSFDYNLTLPPGLSEKTRDRMITSGELSYTKEKAASGDTQTWSEDWKFQGIHPSEQTIKNLSSARPTKTITVYRAHIKDSPHSQLESWSSKESYAQEYMSSDRVLLTRQVHPSEVVAQLGKLRKGDAEVVVASGPFAERMAKIRGEVLVRGGSPTRTDNAFCPTGEGGGVDPTCSSTTSKTIIDDIIRKPK